MKTGIPSPARSKTGIPSPARSLGAPVTPRRYRAGGTRSVGSPVRASASRRPSALAEDLKELRESHDSVVLTPLNRRSLLTDNTDIEEPRRKSWWKKLDDTSLEVAEVFQGDNVNNAHDIVEEFVDIEVPSLLHKNMSLDLPESSGTESIDSIVLPQRRLFTQKENVPRKPFGPAVCPRESLPKLQKNTETEMTANVGHKTLIAQKPTQRSRPAFPANLLAGTPNKTSHDTTMNVAPKKLFGQQDVVTKKKTFTKTLLEASQSKNDNNDQEIAGLKTLFNKDQPPKSKPTFPAELLNVSANKTAPNNTKLVSEIQGQAHNLFGNRAGTKRKNMFADFIVAESEDEIQDIQPQVFGFSKRAGSKEPQSGRGSSVSRGVRESSVSIPTDLELEDWKMLPSSTMMVDQLEEMVTGTPKKIRLSKLSEQKESDGSKASTTANKTKLSNKSTTSKNKSKSIQNSSKSKIVEDNVILDEVATTEKQSKSRTEVEYENVHIINENKTNEKDLGVNMDEMVVVNNATYNIKTTNLLTYQQELEVPSTSQCKEPEITEQNKTGLKSSKEANTEIVDHDDNDDEQMALTYEEDVEEPMVQDALEKQTKNDEEMQEIENIENILKNNTALNKFKQNNIKVSLGNQLDKQNNFELPGAEHSGRKTEGVQPEQLSQTKATDSPKKNAISAEDYAEDNFEDVEINVDSVLQDEVSEITQDDSKVEISLDNKEMEVEESIEQIQKEIDRGEEEENEKESSNVEQNQQNIEHNEEAEKNEQIRQSKQEIEHNEEVDKEGKDVSRKEKRQNQVKEMEQTKEADEIEHAARREAEVKQTQEAMEHDDEIENVKQNEVKHTQEGIKQYDEIANDKEDAEPSEAEVKQSEDEIEQHDEIEEDEEEAEPSNAKVEQTQEETEQDDEIEDVEDEEDAEQSEVEVEQTQEEIEQDEEVKEDEEEANQSEAEVEPSQEEIEQDDEVEEDGEEAEQSVAEVEQTHEEIEQGDIVEEYEEEAKQSEPEVEQTQENIEQEGESEQEDVDAEQSQKEIEQYEEANDQIESDVEQSEERIKEHIEQSQEEEEMEQDQETDNNTSQDSHANLPSEHIPTPEQTDEIPVSPNVSHDTTGRNRNKIRNETQLKSPEAILKGTTSQNTSFNHQGRNTSVRKTKSMVRPLEHNPSLVASIRDSIGTNGSNSSAQGSGWDSHRTTRKTLRQTFGKDFTPRKSLRALVMEKSAQRQTMGKIDVDITKAPQANSTEINVNEEASMPSMVDNVEDLTEDTVSDHELSRKTRQSTLEMYLQKVKKDTLERKMKMESAVRESLKTPSRNVIKQFNLPTKLGSGARKVTKTAQPRKTKTSGLQLGALPKELIEDMKYKPPKRFMPTNASWTTKRLYKFLESKLEPRYDYKARVRAEKLVKTLYSFGKLIQRLDVAPREAIEELKVELARLNVTKTHFEFYDFFHEFMPREMRIKVVPDIQNKLPMPKYGLYSDIIREINSRG